MPKSIWYVTTTFDQEVHAGCLGFTHTVDDFAWGKSAAEACARTKQPYATKDPPLTIAKQTARLSVQQNVETYAFSEQIR